MFSITERVRYKETDKGNRVYHSNYLVWLDMARTEYLRSKGIDYSKFEEDGYCLVVRKASIEYFGSAYFDDEIKVVIKKIVKQKIRVDFYYDIIHNSSQKLLVTAFTQLVCVNDKGKPIQIPSQLKKILDQD